MKLGKAYLMNLIDVPTMQGLGMTTHCFTFKIWVMPFGHNHNGGIQVKLEL